ncbi:MAG: DUF177 domain-containing protein [Clostridiales bacterium]|nr:DUF177 domain-containing protein [Clostridiales bacterium]
MIIQVSEIMNIPEGVKSYKFPLEAKTFAINGCEYEVSQKDDVTVRLTNLGSKKILVEVKTNLTLVVPCDRCLEDVIVPIEIDTAKEIDFSISEEQRAEDLDETSYVTGYDLDVDQLIYEEVLIGFPMKVLCSEECKGICKVCGANLNKGECGCDRTELDPRMSAIRDIFNNFKEV